MQCSIWACVDIKSFQPGPQIHWVERFPPPLLSVKLSATVMNPCKIERRIGAGPDHCNLLQRQQELLNAAGRKVPLPNFPTLK